jgi:excisionase family DNA binding protein
MPDKGYRLRSKNVAHILDCSPDEVIDLAKRGELKSMKSGRYWFFRFQDVETYQKRARKKSAGPEASA